MSLKEAIYNLLTSDATVSSLVSTRVYPEIAPTSSSFPRITYTKISNEHERHLTGESGVAHPTIQIDCWARTALEAETLGEAVRKCLTRYSGTTSEVNIRDIFLEAERDDFEQPDDNSQIGVYRVSFDFVVWHVEDLPNN